MRVLERFLPKKGKKILIGTGIRLRDLPYPEAKRVKIFLPESYRVGHVGIFGTTRTGKTRLGENLIEYDIEDGKSVWIFDPKGDKELLAKVIQTCIRCGRLDEFFFFSPFHLDLSVRMNPLAYWVIPEEIVHHVASGIAGPGAAKHGGDAEFFYKVAKEVLLVVVRSLQVLDVVAGRKPEFNLVRLNHFVSYADLQKLYVQLKNLGRVAGNIEIEGSKVADIVEKELLPKLAQMLAQHEDHFAKVSGTLRTELSQLALGTVSKLFGDVKENPIFERLIEGKPTVFYCATASLMTRDTAHIVGRMLLSGLQSIAGHFNAEGRRFEPPLAVYIDEASNVLYPGMDDLFNKGGGTNIFLTLLTQSLADFETALGKPYTQKILDNVNNQIFLRVNHTGTAQYVSERAGKIRTFSPILSMGGFSSAREMERDLLPASVMTELDTREFVAFLYRDAYMGRTADVSPLHLRLVMPELTLKKPSQADEEEKVRSLRKVLREPGEFRRYH